LKVPVSIFIFVNDAQQAKSQGCFMYFFDI
jgi:hypothetical protein